MPPGCSRWRIAGCISENRAAGTVSWRNRFRTDRRQFCSTTAAIAATDQSGEVRIGIARDDAFAFYYPDDLMAMEVAGATLVEFSPVHDTELPAVDRIFIGGGFPEYRMRELEANIAMRSSIRAFVESGGPLYAECGGLMYLSRALVWVTGTAKCAAC